MAEREVLAAAGTPPERRSERSAWAAAATGRIVAAYHARRYDHARAWYRVEGDGAIRLLVDEGRMRVVFTGIGSVSAFFYGRKLYLPHGVFHEPTLRHELERLRRQHHLVNIYFRVREPGELETNALGQRQLRRVLQIHVLSRGSVGWGFEMGLSSTWGLLPGVSYSRRRLLWADDRLHAEVEIAFPYRRYFFDADPKLQWVHGVLALEYTLPRVARRYLAPRVSSSLHVSRLGRPSLGLARYHLLRTPTLASLVLFLPALELGLGGGVDVISIIQREALPDAADPELVPGRSTAVRGLGRLTARVERRSDVVRRDWRTFLALRCDVIGSETQRWALSSELVGQLFRALGRHRLLVRGRGVLLMGDVRFWDDAQLAGSFQRVFFGDRYWIRRAAQLETAYRINVWRDRVDLGVFHDLSLFADLTRPERPFAAANAFGPSLHVVLIDFFAIDVFMGFGFAPVGFDHTLSFKMQTMF